MLSSKLNVSLIIYTAKINTDLSSIFNKSKTFSFECNNEHYSFIFCKSKYAPKVFIIFSLDYITVKPMNKNHLSLFHFFSEDYTIVKPVNKWHEDLSVLTELLNTTGYVTR